MKTKLLFICSRNQWRSPTAEALFRNHPAYEARSAGTENSARVKVTEGHIGWAELIFCMERGHADRLRARFPDKLKDKTLITLRVPDDYPFMDPELVERLKVELQSHLVLY
ncbi:MAG TPA: protein tyrosine phosphatase [Lacunisphaera sp.]